MQINVDKQLDIIDNVVIVGQLYHLSLSYLE